MYSIHFLEFSIKNVQETEDDISCNPCHTADSLADTHFTLFQNVNTLRKLHLLGVKNFKFYSVADKPIKLQCSRHSAAYNLKICFFYSVQSTANSGQHGSLATDISTVQYTPLTFHTHSCEK